MYSSVTELLTALSLEATEPDTSQDFGNPAKSFQPRVHQMGTGSAPLVEEGVHRNLPEPRELWFTFADTRDRQTVVGETVVQSIRPESISVILRDGNGGRCRRVVGELDLIQKFQSIGGKAEERGTETLDGCKWDAG